VSGSIGSAMSWNLYSYVQGNPMNFTDPYGLRKKSEGSSRTSECNEKKTPKEECDEMGCTYSEKGGIGYCDCGDVVYVYAKDTNYGIPQDMLTGYLWETGTIEDPNFDLFGGHELKGALFGFPRISDGWRYWAEYKGGSRINPNTINKPNLPTKNLPFRPSAEKIGYRYQNPANPIPDVPRSSHLTTGDKILVAIAQLLATMSNIEVFFVGPVVLQQQIIYQSAYPEDCPSL